MSHQPIKAKKITDDLLRPLLETTWKFYVGVAFLGCFVVAGLANEMNAGIAMAREEIESGRALEKLKALQNYRV